MPEQFHEEYRPDRQQFSYSSYEDVPHYNDYFTGIADQQKLSNSQKSPSVAKDSFSYCFTCFMGVYFTLFPIGLGLYLDV